MKKANKLFKIYIGALVFCALFSVGMKKEMAAQAASLDYKFVYRGTEVNSGSEILLDALNSYLNVRSKATEEESGGLPASATVEFLSSDESVVVCESTGTQGMTKLVRKGPGYSTVTAIIKDGDYNYAISCIVRVKLEITNQNFSTIDWEGHQALKLDKVGDKKQVVLKYVDYEGNGEFKDNTLVEWRSTNEMVATVDKFGNVTAVGAGRAQIEVYTLTASGSDKPLIDDATVIVAPVGSFTEDKDYKGYQDKISTQISKDNFMIYINGQSATPLHWKVSQLITVKGKPQEKELSPNSDVMKYSINEYSGSVNFTGVKAGTYVIRAYVDKEYIGNGAIPSFEAKVVVLFDLTDKKLLMNVGDTYDIIENSNIPAADQFTYHSTNRNVAAVDSKGVITAKNSSPDTVTITLSYVDNGIFETGGTGEYATGVPEMTIEVIVIDGIKLNYSEVTIHTKGTVQLDPILTNRVEPVTWTTSDSKIATVENGLVTGIKEGTAVITAQQIINGIVKTATCTVYVQASVEDVTLDPEEITLGIGKYETIQASVKPSSLNGVSLKWVSSNEDIVKITETGRLSVTIQGVAGGNAVISAINQDNVVVGFTSVTVLQPVEGMTLSETEVTSRIGDKVQLRATITPDNATNQEVTWKSSNEKVATVSNNGLVTMKAAGTASIICTSVDNPAVQAFCNVTVLKAVSGVELDIESREMYVGENYRLTYQVTPKDASTPEVIWMSTNTSVVQVDNTGMLTANGVGQAEIIIKTVDGSYMDLCTIVVKQKPTDVKLSVSNLTMNAGEYFYLDPVLTPANSTKEGLVWESVDPDIATVSSSGRVAAKAGGQTLIMVKTENGATAFCKLTVLEAVVSVELDEKEVLIDVGEEISLTPIFFPATASDTTVTWTSSNEDIATVNKDGEVVGVSGGVAVIECKTYDGGYNAFCIVTVYEEVTSLKIVPEQYKLGLGKTYTLSVEINKETATNKEVEWFSSDEDVVTVDQKGRIKGISLGYATITAVALDGSDAEATCEIRVVTEVTGMTMNYTSITLIQGNTFQLDAAIRPADATYNTPAWESDNPDIAMVDDDGIVTAISPGTAWVTASARDSSGKYCKCFVTVIEPIPATGVTTMVDEIVMAPGEKKTVVAKATPANTTDSMMWTSSDESIVRVNPVSGEITAIAPGNATVIVMMDSGKKAVINVIVVGLNRTSVVMDYYSSGVTLYVEGAKSTVRWYSTNPRVVEVNNGRLTSRGSGTATVEARVNGRTLTCTVRVISP
ncbi:MAG: Ig-like domain-containing protein [Lachnospiraceae bacterium]|nr:Ig-like domain-containing protein [Lachnospiraceae bacterium]